ncbi:MAG: polysaccharide deacetylase family protein, partial [Chloroflexota bacterium]|nr:polysaccharide deacetylase family protein [Chloroflexota bacterium]
EYIAKIIPLWLYPALMRRDVIGVFYHAVSDEPMEHVRHHYPVVPVAQFEAALLYLKSRNNFITYEELHAHYAEGTPLPAKAIHLSFDDGFAECFTLVRPLLRKYDIPCTFFLATDWLDNRVMFFDNKVSLVIQKFSELTDTERSGIFATLHQKFGVTLDSASFIPWVRTLRYPDETAIDKVCQALKIDTQAFLRERQPYLTIAQIQQMHAEGFTIGAHTKAHHKLINLSDAERESEIVESCQIIREITGQEIVPFAFPNSAFGIDRRLLADIRARHPFLGLLFDTKGLRRDVDFIINRVWAERVPAPKVGEIKKLMPFPSVLHTAYQETWVEEIMEMTRKLMGKK